MDFIDIEDKNDNFVDIGYVDNKSFYSSFSQKNDVNKLLTTTGSTNKGILKNPNGNSLQQQPGIAPQNKKSVTYDDILSSLNMKVVNGKLQINRGDASSIQPQIQSPFQQKNKPLQVIPKHNNSHYRQNDFYTKFVQAQAQSQMQPHPAEAQEIQPLTPEQQKRLLMIQYLKNQQQKQRISKIKSKKLTFI